MAMKLRQLRAPWPALRLISGEDAVLVTAVSSDSRRVGPGSVFVAVRGTSSDGHRFLEQAAAKGCSAVIVEEQRLDEATAVLDQGAGPALLTAPVTRSFPALLAREIAARPDEELCVAGVTGTNGKTTTAFLLQGMLGKLRGPCGLLGTIHYDDGRSRETAVLTTPGGEVLYHWLERMVASGCRSAALEVSSHALDQERCAGLSLDVAVLTNLGRDHLDYHGDQEHYLAAKARILDLVTPGADRSKAPGAVAINVGDPALRQLVQERRAAGHQALAAAATVRYCARPEQLAREEVDLEVTDSQLNLGGTRLSLRHRDERLELHSPLVGDFNAENLTAALAAGLALGLPAADCVAALAGLTQVPGRLERFRLPRGGLAVVDYAHTPDALAAVLASCDELSDGRLIVVFGCGGDRDRGKRPLMGEVAARHADQVWITSDNPRSEEPATICAEIRAGFQAVRRRRAAPVQVIVDRSTAIVEALASAAAEDIVVVAGKGHEDYQLIGDQRLDLDDRQVVKNWIAEQGAHG